MSLEVILTVPGASQPDLKNLAEKLPSGGKLSLRPMKDSLLFWKWKGFRIDGLDDGLTQASAKSENWQLDQATREGLSELLRGFARACPRIFSLYASADGELPKRESELQLSELLEVIAEGRLGNRVTYRVRELPPKIMDDGAEPLGGLIP